MRILLSLLLGILPQTLFFMLFITKLKGIKTKRIKLTILLFVICALLNMIIKYNLYLYLLFIPIYYIILKLLYKKKTQIVDIFIIALSFTIMMLISYFCSLIYRKNMSLYWLGYVINNILLFGNLAIIKLYKKFYKFYCKNWNRKAGNKIKSITLRNISLISINVAIVIADIILINNLK